MKQYIPSGSLADVLRLLTPPNSDGEVTPHNRMVGEMVNNILGSRREFINRFFDRRRDIDSECGYPETINMDLYGKLWDRHAIAGRVVEVLPKECWQVQPVVYEDEDPEVETEFEQDWNSLSQSMGYIPNWHIGDCGSLVMEALRRADILSGIGRYGVMVLGLDDGQQDLSQPAVPREGMKLTGVRVLPEYLAKITSLDDTPGSVRRGQPLMYDVTFGDPKVLGSDNTVTFTGLQSKKVHWTRVVHVVDNVTSSDVYGMPRCQQVFDQLMDSKKVGGGSAEMYWKGAFPGLSVESVPGMGGDQDFDEEGTKRMMEEYMNGLQRYLSLIGMTVKSIAPQVVDPTPQMMIQIQIICIKLGIPMRIFMGSERGQLASAQDDASWNDRLRARQRDQVTPRVVVPFVNHLLWLGVLRKLRNTNKDNLKTPPKRAGYTVWWPDMTSQTGQEKSQIAFQRTQALVQYIKGEGWRIIPPIDFLVTILGLEEMQAVSMLNKAKDMGLFDLNAVVTSGRQDDYTNLGRGDGAKK